MSTENNSSGTELEVVKDKLVGLDEVRKKLINVTLDGYNNKINSLNNNIRNLKLLKFALTGVTIISGGTAAVLGSFTIVGTIPAFIGAISAVAAGSQVVVEELLSKTGINYYLNKYTNKRDLYNNLYSSLSYFRLTCLADNHVSDEEYFTFMKILNEHKELMGKIQYGMDEPKIFTEEERLEINKSGKERIKVAVDRVQEQVIKKKADKEISKISTCKF